MRSRTLGALAGLLVLAVGCAAPDPVEDDEMTTETKPTIWSVIYADGSGNTTRLWQVDGEPARFDYDPVTARESSSGTYSGGEPKLGELSDEQATELWERVETLEADTSLHTDKRMMMTGSFELQKPDREATFIVKNTPELEEFNAFVRRLRGD